MENDIIANNLIQLIKKEYPNISDNELIEQFDVILSKSYDEILDLMYKNITKTTKREMRKIINYDKGFKKRLYRRWKIPIDLLKSYIQRCLTEGRNIVLKRQEIQTVEDNNKFEILSRFHGKAIQISNEILQLLLSGLIDGAFARWRSIYEIFVFSNYLLKQEDIISERFINYQFIEDFKKEEFEYEITNVKTVQYNELKAFIEKLKLKYGNNFVKKYGWLSDDIQQKDKRFAYIENIASDETFKKYYKESCTYVHSGADSFYNSLGFYYPNQSNKTIIAGSSNYGLDMPGKMTAILLTMVTTNLLSLNKSIDSVLTIDLLSKLMNDIVIAFEQYENILRNDEEKIRERNKKDT